MNRRVAGAAIGGLLMLTGAACAPPSPTAVRITPESELDHQYATISADGSTVVSLVSSQPKVAVIDVATKDYRLFDVGTNVGIAGVSGDGAYALLLGYDATFSGTQTRRIDLDTGELTTIGTTSFSFDAQISYDGSVITRPNSTCSVTCISSVAIWRNGVVQTVELPGSAADQVLSSDGSTYVALITNYPTDPSQKLVAVDTATGAVTTLAFELPAEQIWSIEGASATGDELRVTGSDGRAWTLSAGQPPQSRRACGYLTGSVWGFGQPSPDGRYCVEQEYGNNGDSRLRVVDTTTGAVRQVVASDSGLVTPKFSARPSVADTGRTVYSFRLANENGAALYIDG